MDEKILIIIKKYIPFIKQTQTGELIFRCPNCGDSDKSYHGHFYVNEKSLNYNCFKCGTNGKNIIQFLINLINNSSQLEKIIDINDKNMLLRESYKIFLPNNNQEDTKIIPGTDLDVNTTVLINNYNLQDDFIKLLNKKRTIQEQFIVDTVYIPYFRMRIQGQEKVQNKLSKEGKLYFYYSDEIQKIDSYTPDTLLNRIYFKLDNTFFTSRKVSDHIEYGNNNKKYLYYHAKTNNVMPPFKIESDNNPNNIQTIYFTEGIFDQIKLYQFLEDDQFNYSVMTLNGKIFSKEQIRIVNDNYCNQIRVILILDSDTTEQDIKQNIRIFKANIDRLSIELLIGKFLDTTKFKDLGEMTHKDNLKDIDIFSSNKYQIKGIMDKLDLVKKFFSGVV